MPSLHAGAPTTDEQQRRAAATPSLQAIDADIGSWRDGLLDEVTKAVLEAALEAELVEHLRAGGADPLARRAGGNCRNGTRAKTVRTVVGPITIDAPRDRWGTFQPVTVGKWQRRVPVLDRLVLPMAAAGVTLQDCVELLAVAHGRAVSPRLVVSMAASVRARLDGWHERPLPSAYAAVLLDRAVVRSRSLDAVARPVHTAVGVSTDGHRDLLGLWMRPPQELPGGWCDYVAGLRTRGLVEVDAVVTDGCEPLEDTLAATWPQATVHLRAAGAHDDTARRRA